MLLNRLGLCFALQSFGVCGVEVLLCTLSSFSFLLLFLFSVEDFFVFLHDTSGFFSFSFQRQWLMKTRHNDISNNNRKHAASTFPSRRPSTTFFSSFFSVVLSACRAHLLFVVLLPPFSVWFYFYFFFSALLAKAWMGWTVVVLFLPSGIDDGQGWQLSLLSFWPWPKIKRDTTGKKFWGLARFGLG